MSTLLKRSSHSEQRRTWNPLLFRSTLLDISSAILRTSVSSSPALYIKMNKTCAIVINTTFKNKPETFLNRMLWEPPLIWVRLVDDSYEHHLKKIYFGSKILKVAELQDFLFPLSLGWGYIHVLLAVVFLTIKSVSPIALANSKFEKISVYKNGSPWSGYGLTDELRANR